MRRNGCRRAREGVPKRSTQLTVGVDLPERADLLISEVLSDKLLEERVLSSTVQAPAILLKPNAQS